ncbi:MAG: GNAT family N-acetyltransferase [Planctomycetota bacterium]
MAVKLFDTPDTLETVAEEWRRLADDHPLRGYDWHAGWWSHYGGSGQLFVLGVTDDDGRLIGLAPWRIEQSMRRGSAIRWLGDGEVCTDHLTLLAEPGLEQRVACEIADYLTDDFTEWDLLKLDDVDAKEAIIGQLANALAERDGIVAIKEAGACWTIDLPSDWEEFLACQSKSHRKQLRRAERRVLDSDRCTWHPVETQVELAEAWPIFVDLHQRRRQSLGEPGCFASPRFEAFHRELAGKLLERDQLRLSWLELEGRPAAAEYHFAGQGAVYAYQGGVDPDLLDDEPGRLSNIATIKAAIEAGVTTFDFLRGDEPYKAHWRAVPKPTVHLQVVPPRQTARFRAGANQLAGAVRSGLKSLAKD